MTTHALLIPEDISDRITRIEFDDDYLAQVKSIIGAEFDLCAASFDRRLVIAVDEWGSTDVNGPPLPLNMRAWVMYGRAPLFGPAVVWPDTDDTGHHPEVPVDAVEWFLLECLDGDGLANVKAQMEAVWSHPVDGSPGVVERLRDQFHRLTSTSLRVAP